MLNTRRFLSLPLRRNAQKVLHHSNRLFSASSVATDQILPDREVMPFDVVIVGAGPAGLAAAIRIKQKNSDITVCIVEKGEEVGSHIISGNVFETRALDELLPDWKQLNPPPHTPVSSDQFQYLTQNSAYSVPYFLLPSQLHNNNNYIISLSQFTRWLATQAENIGVEIYPGFAASTVLYGDSGAVIGVATSDMGIAKNGTLKDTYTRGIELHAKQTLFAEGCRGSCSEEVMTKFSLRDNDHIQSYGIGLKEVWEVPLSNFKSGYVGHTLGWPLQHSIMTNDVYGGTFLYHMEPNLVFIGMVIGLDYTNTHLNPYKEFQRWKHHSAISKHLQGGKCISYGARALNEGGYHSIPKLTFPGGALIGCSAGFLNSVKIKGSHTAMKSGMLAADAIVHAYSNDSNTPLEEQELVEYETSVRTSWVMDELKVVRNSHASFKYGLLSGLVHTALSSFITGGAEPWTLTNHISDADRTKKAADCPTINYPKPDGVLSFDLLSNLQRSGTFHDHDQPSHLVVKEGMSSIPSAVSITEYDGPEQRFCPANVYEYTDPDSNGQRSLIINAQNCLHCKTCSIKMPKEYIEWRVPEGGGGPKYTVM